MIFQGINAALSAGEIGTPGLFPYLDALKQSPFILTVDFGLDVLPKEAGILMVRGARQYGKSTWLEQELYKTIQEFGPGTAYYLNGDYIADVNQLEQEIETLIQAYPKEATIRRLFIDEITAIPHWEVALKRMADQGKLSRVLIVTTGSKATDLRRGAEKLPGRKGKLKRSSYLFTPISYKAFHGLCKDIFKEHTLIAYLLSGGSPIACSELAVTGVIPEYVSELARDWVEGEIAASGRNRSALINVMNVLFRFAGTPVGQAKLAREAGLSNNTVAAGYIEILSDLACVIPAYPWDSHRKQLVLRRPCKYHFTNLLAAVAYYPARLRSVNDFLLLPKTEQAKWYEWLVAQEIMRRSAIRGGHLLEPMAFWQNKTHEVDFVDQQEKYIEVKRGKCTALEFSWFAKQFSNKQLIVVNSVDFETEHVRGMSIENFLLSAPD